jgi:hypothetical protein
MAKERNTEAQRAGGFKDKFEAGHEKVVTLNRLLRERSKEMLALERLYNREWRRQFHSLASLGSVVVENQHLISEIDGHKWKQIDRQFAKAVSGKTFVTATHQINPAFLGDGYYA